MVYKCIKPTIIPIYTTNKLQLGSAPLSTGKGSMLYVKRNQSKEHSHFVPLFTVMGTENIHLAHDKHAIFIQQFLYDKKGISHICGPAHTKYVVPFSIFQRMFCVK